MPSKPQPKAHILPDGIRFSWDKPEKPERPLKYTRRCKRCQVYLTTLAEERLGIHIHCVQEINIQQRSLEPLMRNRPRYGS